jgi:hypothetical protein
MPDPQEPQLSITNSQPLPDQGLSIVKTDPLAGASQATGVSAAPGRLEQGLENASNFAEDVTNGISKGAVSTLGGLTSLIGEGLNRIPGIGEKLAPRAGLNAEKDLLKKGTATDPSSPGAPGEKVGGALEEGAEWMAGDEALKGLASLAKVAKNAPHLIKILEKYPKASKLILDSAKGAAIGGTQAGVKAPAEGKDVVQSVEAGAAGGAAGGVVGSAADLATGPESKAARGLVNRSLGATARDTTYGNPAKALLDENIVTPVTGDAELYKASLRDGKPPSEAAQAAGGRIAAVSGRLNEYEPQLTAVLKASKAKIPVKTAILDPIYDATSEIINHAGMSGPEKDAAIDRILEFQKELISGLGKDITPEQALKIKRDIGDRINWTGATAVTDEVKPVYRKLYGSMKSSIHAAVPEAKPLDEKMTNLMAAWGDLNPGKPGSLPLREEVEAGSGPMSGGFKGMMGRLEAAIGRIIPAAHAVAKNPATKAAVGITGEEAVKQALPPRNAGMVRFRSSDGAVHDVPQDQLPAAQKIDPNLKVIEQD